MASVFAEVEAVRLCLKESDRLMYSCKQRAVQYSTLQSVQTKGMLHTRRSESFVMTRNEGSGMAEMYPPEVQYSVYMYVA